MKASAIKGMSVVSIADGTKLGSIDDVVFDTGQLRVAALQVSADRQHALIPFDRVRSIGSDAVMVPSADVPQWAGPPNPAAGQCRLDELGKMKVVNEGGTLLGTVSGVEIEPQDGQVTELQVHKGGVLGIGGTSHTIAAKDVISSSGDVITVRESAVS